MNSARQTGTLSRTLVIALAALAAILLATAIRPVPAAAQLTIASFDGSVSNLDPGEVLVPATQAGSHPDYARTTMTFDTVLHSPFGSPVPFPVESLKNTHVELPAGFVGNPQAVTQCLDRELTNQECPVSSQVGGVVLEVAGITYKVPLFNMDQGGIGTPARLGMNVVVTGPIYLDAGVRTGSDYGVDIDSYRANQAGAPITIDVTVWGVPADPANDKDRGSEGVTTCFFTTDPTCSNPSGLSKEIPFITLPTSCTGPVETALEVDSWENPGIWDRASFLSHDFATPTPNPVGNEGCNAVPFGPSLKARPTTNVADSPTGLEVDLKVPQNQAPGGIATAHLRDTTVTLPEGLTVNPASANGLAACSPAQIDLKGKGPANCPNGSKLGTVEVDTPLLDHPVPGAVYLAAPYENPFNSLLAIYIALHDPQTGIVVKIAGEVHADPVTGQLTTTVKENPQLPFEDFKLNFFGGAGASLRTPATCGTHTTTSSLTPWSAPDSGPPATPSDPWAIIQGPGGTCANTQAARVHAPSFDAGVVSPIAGSHSPFVVNLRREDSSQEFSAVTLNPPPGLVAKLAGTATCSQPELDAAAAKAGREEQASPSCPAASEVGSVIAGAGAGPAPYYTGGKAYLAGPYKGAPLSLAIVTPAVAGPFDLGTVVVRTALHVDPKTAQITAVSDPIPHILQGIVLDIRSVSIRMDRPDFVLTPTSCDPMAVSGQLTSTLGQSASLSSRFQLAECGRLDFKPRMSLQLKGGTKRTKYPSLTAVLQPRPGDANIASVSVALPRSEFLAQEHIRTVCTRVQWAADQCPEAAIYGEATVTTPLLDYQLSGPVYLRSSDNLLPDLVPDLRGPAYQPIRLEASGRTDSVNRGIRNTFDIVPDAPFSKFVLRMQGGKKGLLVNSRDICEHTYRATVTFTAHNGLTHVARPALKAQCGKKKPAAKRKGGAAKRRGE